MPELYDKVKEARVIEEAQRVEKLLLEACDSDTRTLLRLADISIWPCGYTHQPQLIVDCKSREIAEAIGVRHAYIKSVLKRITDCHISMAVHYKISEGLVYFDTEGKYTPARWYLCNRKEFGKTQVPLY